MSRKILKKIYIYRESHLPEKGWLQSCYHCCGITVHYKLIKIIKLKDHIYNHWEFNVFLCKKCQKFLYEKKNILECIKFNKKCNDYIKYNYPFLFSS